MSNIDWTLTRNDIFERALYQIGALAEGQTIDDRKFRMCIQNLNIATQELQRFNLFVWNTVPYTLATAASDPSYSIPGNDVVGIDTATYTDPNGARITLRVRPYSDFLRYSTPNITQGISNATSVYIDTNYATPTIYITPTPDNVYSLSLNLVKKLKDWDSASGNDFPPWWVGTLIAMLSARLAPEFGRSVQDCARFDAMAADAVERSRIDCFKNVNFDFQPDSETYERN